MMRVSALALLSVVGVATSFLAACAVPTPLAGRPAAPSIRGYVQGIHDKTHAIAMVTRSLDVDVAVRGAIAETEMTFLVAAPTGTTAPIEGRLHVDLPTGAIVTGYALDVNGGLVDGSLIDQSKARAAYERQVRKQTDPGLTIVDQTGDFNTRIFPIDAEHGRRVRLRFVAPVSGEYRLPLTLPAKARLTVHVRQPGLRNPPVVSLGGARIRTSAGFAEGTATGPVGGTLRIQLPPTREALTSRHSSGEEYWQLSGSLPKSAAASGGTLRVYWDRSRSRREDDHNAELARVREAILALRPTSVEWVDFSSGRPNRSVISSDGELDARVHRLRYGGATDFGSLSAEAAAANCLFVSDGRSTFGPSTPPRLPCRLFTIASKGANVAVLQQMADASGGRLINGPSQAADWTVPSVAAVNADGRSIEFVSLPAPAGFWRIAIPAPKRSKVILDVGGEKVTRFGETSATSFDGEAVLIAASRLALLGDTGDRRKFVDLSRHYSVASPTLSFVVLEKPEDYIQYEVTPPTNYTRRDEWNQLAAEVAEAKAAAGKERFAELLIDWEQQVAWWDKKFNISVTLNGPDEGKVQQPTPATMMSNAPPSPAPPPPPPRSGERGGDLAPAPPTGAERPVVAGSLVSSPNDVQIAVSAWRPDRDYLDAFDADPAAFDRVFAEWDKKAGDVPSFYLDTADWLYRRGRTDVAIETLLSALDLPIANEVTLGMVASRLERYGAMNEAIRLREKHAALDAEHPQPKRLLALALARRASLGKANAAADIESAIRLLIGVALSPLDTRWKGIDLIALVEANALLSKLKALGGCFELDPRLTKNLESDVRVVLDWSNDAADIDLWVDEPNGQRAIYSYPRTLVGGHLSDDMTSGFGPEEYFLRRAAAGRYTVRANVFSPDRLDPNGLSRVTAHLFRDWGRPSQREESIDLDLQQGQHGEVRIGTLRVGDEN